MYINLASYYLQKTNISLLHLTRMTMSEPQKAPVNWPASIMLIGTPIIALIAIPTYAYFNDFSTAAWISLFVLLAFSGLGITAGYHRLWSHRAYNASLPLQIFLMLGGTMAIQNSILYWSAGHRVHHRFVDDEDKDPYSIRRGFWYAHIGWMLRNYPSSPKDYSNVPDLLNDKLVMFQHNHYVPLVIVVHVVLLLGIGWVVGDVWGVVLLGGLLRLIISHHVTFFINSLCHMYGNRPYTDENTARDNFLLAIPTWGEGYHNYHHIFQYDYRNGVKWWQYDPTKWLIWTCSKLGLASNLRRIPAFNIKKAELAMKFKYAEQDLAIYGLNLSEDMQTIKQKMSQEYDDFCNILNEWKALKEQELKNKRETLNSKIQDLDEKMKAEFTSLEHRLAEQHQRVEQLMKGLKKTA